MDYDPAHADYNPDPPHMPGDQACPFKFYSSITRATEEHNRRCLPGPCSRCHRTTGEESRECNDCRLCGWCMEFYQHCHTCNTDTCADNQCEDPRFINSDSDDPFHQDVPHPCKCHRVAYCSKRCRQRHWKRHRHAPEHNLRPQAA